MNHVAHVRVAAWARRAILPGSLAPMRLSRDIVDDLVAHAREDAPNECCGIIAAENGRAVRLFRATNAEASPVRYSLDPREQYAITMEIEEHGWELGAIYHSHTRSPAYPSQTDVNLAFYPDALYVIVSVQDLDRPDVRAFRIVEGRIEPIELEIDGPGDSAS
jgi:proteasome lid subunit RPN8/RPN11